MNTSAAERPPQEQLYIEDSHVNDNNKILENRGDNGNIDIVAPVEVICPAGVIAERYFSSLSDLSRLRRSGGVGNGKLTTFWSSLLSIAGQLLRWASSRSLVQHILGSRVRTRQKSIIYSSDQVQFYRTTCPLTCACLADPSNFKLWTPVV